MQQVLSFNNHQSAAPMLFLFGSATVRVVTGTNGEPWFVSADVCTVLDIGNNRQAVVQLDDDEKGVTTVDTLGGAQQMTIINESGLYTLVLGSRKPEAKRFKKWVTSEVLPTIRKTGTYSASLPALPDFTNPAAAARAWAEQYEGKAKAETALSIAAPKAEALDRIAEADGAFCLTNAAKMLKSRRDHLIAFLQFKKWIYRRAGSDKFVGYQHYTQIGYVTHKVASITRTDGTEKVVEQVLITPKGLAKLAQLLGATAHIADLKKAA